MKLEFTFFYVTETTPLFLEILNLASVPKNWRAWQVVLEDIGFLEDFCYHQGYCGWICRTKTSDVVKHVKALGGEYYGDDTILGRIMMCFVKYVKKDNNRYPIKEHMKHVREVLDAKLVAR